MIKQTCKIIIPGWSGKEPQEGRGRCPGGWRTWPAGCRLSSCSKSGLKQIIIWVYNKSMSEQSSRWGGGGVSFNSGARTCKRGERDQYEPSLTATVQLVPGVWARELAIGLHSDTLPRSPPSSSTPLPPSPPRVITLHLASGGFHPVIHHSVTGKNNLCFKYWNRK